MSAKVFAATNLGFDGKIIEVESDASNGLPSFIIVGLPSKAVDEAKERIRSAIKNSKLEFPRKRVTINLAPANLPKEGSHFDLPIAISVIALSDRFRSEMLKDSLILGELALDGTLRPVRGVIGQLEAARKMGLRRAFIPHHNFNQAKLVDGIEVIPISNLVDLVVTLRGERDISSLLNNPVTDTAPLDESQGSGGFFDIKGQEQAKRAIIIACAGHHNILMSGPPGAGKTMLAKAATEILPDLEGKEIIEVSKLHSLSSEDYDKIIIKRPFRSPHHSASQVAMTGGGRVLRPGEISLAHKGILFLDEIPEYSRHTLESLRQPLEEQSINLVRANDRATYPADFMLIATQNPCPCGYATDPNRECSCSAQQVLAYQKKISGPLLDRIDMVIELSRVETERLLGDSDKSSMDGQKAKQMVTTARQAQSTRYKDRGMFNSRVNNKGIKNRLGLSDNAKEFLNRAADRLDLTARSYFKVIKVARTIADLENSPSIESTHIAEALQYRPKQQNRS